MSTYKCRYCKIDKELCSDNFKVERRISRGFDSVCRMCRRDERNTHRKNNRERFLSKEAAYRNSERYKIYHKKYWNENRDKLNDNSRERYLLNPEPYLKRSKEQRAKNPDGYKAYLKQWRIDNRKHLNQYVVDKLHTDINFKLRHTLRTKLRKMLNGLNKTNSALTYLGCSIDFFHGYLEAKFRDGMTWENYGKLWHIDHILPCASFDLTQESDRFHCFHYSNMQPLLASENLSKGDKIMLTNR